MLEYIVTIVFGSAVFMIFILVFLRKNNRGERGARLAGCSHHGSESQCDRCRHDAPISILAHPPDADNP